MSELKITVSRDEPEITAALIKARKLAQALEAAQILIRELAELVEF